MSDPPLTDDLLDQAAALGAATVHEAAGRVGQLPHEIAHRCGAPVAGRALTVQAPCGDNLWLHRALAEAEPGDLLVVEVAQGPAYGYWGEVMAVAAQARGVTGLVIDGGVRDVAQMAELGFSVWSRQVAIRGTLKDPSRLGSVGMPLVLDGVRIERGDLVVADTDGVVVISRADAVAVVQAGHERVMKEDDLMARLRDGELTVDLLGLR